MSQAWMSCTPTQRGAAVGVPSLPGIFLGKACPSAQRDLAVGSPSSSPLGTAVTALHCSVLVLCRRLPGCSLLLCRAVQKECAATHRPRACKRAGCLC